MSERNYKKKISFQQNVISRQSKQIEELKLQNEILKSKIKEKDEFINSVSSLRDELIKDSAEVKKYKKEYKKLIDEVRKMKDILNQTVYKGRWRLIKLLLK